MDPFQEVTAEVHVAPAGSNVEDGDALAVGGIFLLDMVCDETADAKLALLGSIVQGCGAISARWVLIINTVQNELAQLLCPPSCCGVEQCPPLCISRILVVDIFN